MNLGNDRLSISSPIFQVLDELVSSDIQLMDRDFLQVFLSLARAGHHQHLPQILERLRQEHGFVPGRKMMGGSTV